MTEKFLRNARWTDRAAFYTGVILSAGFIVLIFASLAGASYEWTYLNADKLYSPVIFRDLFTDGTGIRGWHLNAAPNFFPDMALYFLIMAIFRDVPVSDFVFSLVQYLGFLFLVFALFRQLDPQRSYRFAGLFVLLMFLFLLIPVFTERFLITFQLLSISYHFGASIMALASLNLLLGWWRTGNRAWLTWLGLLAALGTLSDRLYLVQFVFPVLALALLLVNPTHRKTLIPALITTLAGAATGWVLFNLVNNSDALHVVKTGFKMFNFDNIANSWHTLAHHMKDLFLNHHAERLFLVVAFAAFAGTTLYLVTRLKRLFTGQTPGEWNRRHYILIILALFMPAVFFAPVINGAYVGPAIIRFNFIALVMGTILLPLWLMSWPATAKRIAPVLRFLVPFAALALLGVFLGHAAGSQPVAGLHRYFGYYPERIRVVDSLIDTHNLRYGISDYWQSKPLLMYSRNGARVYPVHDRDFRPSYHTTNENWFHSGGKGRHRDPVFNFVIMDNFDQTGKLENLFKGRMDTIYHDTLEDILVVKVPPFRFRRGNREIELLDPESLDQP